MALKFLNSQVVLNLDQSNTKAQLALLNFNAFLGSLCNLQ